MTTHNERVTWERTINLLLGKDKPCKECLVRVTCTKSFREHSACDKLARKLQERINKEKKNEN